MKTLFVLLFSILLSACSPNQNNNSKDVKSYEPTLEQMKSINECIKSATNGDPSFHTEIIKTCRNVVLGIVR